MTPRHSVTYLSRSKKRHISEGEIARRLLGNFTYLTSRSYHFFESVFPSPPNRNALIAIGQVASVLLGIKLERAYTRKKSLMYKWFDMHLDKVEKIFDYVSLNFCTIEEFKKKLYENNDKLL